MCPQYVKESAHHISLCQARFAMSGKLSITNLSDTGDTMTNIEKLAALFRKVATLNDDFDGSSVDYAVGLKLAEMIKNGEEVLAAVTGDAVEAADGGFNMLLMIAPCEDGNYFMAYPNKDIAAAMHTGYTMCRIEELLTLVSETPQMSGIQLILGVDGTTGRFSAGTINRSMAELALKAAEK